MLDVEVAAVASGWHVVVEGEGVVPRRVVAERIDLVVASGNVQRIGGGGGLRGGDHAVFGSAGTVAPGGPGGIGLCQMAAGRVGVKVVAEDNGLRECERHRGKHAC